MIAPTYKGLNDYASYRRYMQETYGEWPWTNVRPEDKFLAWKRRMAAQRDTNSWKEAYREQVFLFKHGSIARSRSENRSKRGKSKLSAKRVPLPGTLA